MPVSSPASSKGDSVPLRYAPGSGETGSDNPLSSAQRTRPRRRKVNCPFGAREGALGHVAGRGVKVRQSWTFTREFYAAHCGAPVLPVLPKAKCGRRLRPSGAKGTLGVPFLFSQREKVSAWKTFGRLVFCGVKTQVVGKTIVFLTKMKGFLLFSCPHDMIVLK